MRVRFAGGAVVATVAVGTLLSGCGQVGTAGNAATVDGRVILEGDAQQAAQEFNKSGLDQKAVSTRDVVWGLVAGPTLAGFAKEQGAVISDELIVSALGDKGVRNPNPATVEFVRYWAFAGQIPEQSQATFAQKLTGLNVVLNPRYGTWRPELRPQGALTQPDWIAKSAAPAQP